MKIKRILSVFLTICMLLSIIPMTNLSINAEGPEFYAVLNDNTLSFYYDENKATRLGTVYDNLPTEAVQSKDWGYNSNRSSINNVIIDESVKDYHGLKSTAYMFYGIVNATNISGCEYLDVSNVTNMCSTFYGFAYSTQGMNVVPNVSNWNTLNVTNMSKMFSNYAYSSTVINLVPHLSDWITPNVTDMSDMFSYYAYSSVITLNPLYLPNSIASLENADGMFRYYAKKNFDQPVVYASDWATLKPTGVSATNMFSNSKLKNASTAISGNQWALATTSDAGCFTKKPVAIIGDTKYDTVAAALAASHNNESETNPTIITLICDATENITIPQNRNITLDLNGFVLKGTGTGRVITCADSSFGAKDAANLTIKDSNTGKQSHNFTVGDDGLWTLTDKVATKNYESLVDSAEVGDIIKVVGGCITGGIDNNPNPYGGGINSYGLLTLESGNIIGNMALGSDTYINGGGIYTNSDFTMLGGIIAGNAAIGSNENAGGAGGVGGGIYCSSDATITIEGGRITDNRATCGGGISLCGNIIMKNGEILRNNASRFGGGIYSECAKTVVLEGGIISGNVAGDMGGGVTMNCDKVILGGTINITSNIANGKANNCELWGFAVELGTKTGEAAEEQGNGILIPTEGMNVGVTLLGLDEMEEIVSVGGQFTTNGINTDTKYFFSDNKEYGVKYNNSDGGYLELANTPDVVKNATYSAYLTLSKNIDVNLKISNIPDAIENELSITVDGNPVSKTFKDGIATGVLKAVSPSEIGKDIRVVVAYDGIIVKNFNYSVKTYCEAVYNHSSYGANSKLGKLCTAILNYGKYAEDYPNEQDYANHIITTLPAKSTLNDGHEIDLSNITLPTSQRVYTCNTTYGGDGSGAYLGLGSTIKLNYLVKTSDFDYKLVLFNGLSNPEAIAQGKYKTGNTPYEQNFFILNSDNKQIDPAKISVSEVEGGYLISVDLYANQLSNEYTLKVKGVESSEFCITLGVYDYCTEVQSLTDAKYTDTLKSLCKTIYAYSEAVKAYSAQ